MKLEDLQPDTTITGILANESVTVVNVRWFGSDALELTYKTSSGKVGNEILYRQGQDRLEIVKVGRPWNFDGDGARFRLVSEALRIRLAHLFDPLLAVHSSVVDPLPHQITAVYEAMLPRQPLRFLLADDPGAGKTIMAGLLIRELMARGDLERCLVVCPGSLAEQWQDELYNRFQLSFEILTNDKLESARSGNWFKEPDLAIARLDKLSRAEDVQAKLQAPDCGWDLVVCDEAHKMSARYFGNEVKYTKRYHLGQLLSGITRHFLLMTATPHNGKEEDFRLFMSLLDSDRFEGRLRTEGDATDASDLMRRMIKEKLLRFDGTPLFPERIAYTVSYRLSDAESSLYEAVTNYVKEEFNRAEALSNGTRAGTVGFALTILQRRLASSPEAIYQSLRRRRERLEGRLLELESLQRKGHSADDYMLPAVQLGKDDLEDLEDAPGDEIEDTEERLLDQATAASSIAELNAVIEALKHLEALAARVSSSGVDTKWNQLSGLLEKIFTSAGIRNRIGEPELPYGAGKIPEPQPSPRQKLVIFTEHRDTLTYLQQRITTFQGRLQAVVLIHGGMKREDRNHAQDAFRNDPQVQVLIATDAASEGINLQRAHLMVNYDLPWNPNRIEQRFGRVHRIGQTEVCHLWNLIADDTREGDVYRTLLEKLEQARNALGGQVFDVLGKLHFDGRPLRELMVEAIRYGEQPEVRARLNTALDDALDRDKIRDLLEDHALAQDVMDTSRVQRVRERMERAQLRRLQPYFIELFLREACQAVGGTLRQRETRRYEITHVPAVLKNRDRLKGAGLRIQSRYERITFDKSLVTLPGRPTATLVCPGHPLLDALTDLVLERDRGLLRRGAILVDERDAGTTPRVLFYLEHAIQDASQIRSGERRVISKRILYVETDEQDNITHLHNAPYLDYRPLDDTDPEYRKILARDECRWIDGSLEDTLLRYTIEHVVPEHLKEVRETKLALVAKTEAAVKERLTREIAYWDRRAEDLKLQEQAGKRGARLNSGEARKRADMLQARLDKRMEQLRLEAQISPLPPVALGGALVVPQGLIDEITGRTKISDAHTKDTQAAAARARAVVMETERALGFIPVDRETEKLGYDIESAIPDSGRLRFIEVKGRVAGAPSITVTRNEILYSLNKPDDYILAIVEFLDDDRHNVHYLRRPFNKEPDAGATSVNYGFKELLARAEAPG